MNYYATHDDAATLAAMLTTMGHRLHTTQVGGPLVAAVTALGGVPFIRCRTLWEPGLERAKRLGGSGAADAAVALAMEGASCVIAGSEDAFAVRVAAAWGLPVFGIGQAVEVMAHAAHS